MPRIPVYNITSSISGQAGSTATPQISQAATSGAIASQTDSLVTGLQNVSKVAANVVKLESDRIIAKENIKYKTLLDTTEKLIQANLADQPERWMDAYENGFTIGEQYVPGRLAIATEIRNNKYKYDFINQSVANNFEVNNLTIREGLFDNYLKETKKQNLIVIEEQSNILGGDLGNSVNMDTPEFDAKLVLLQETLAAYVTSGGNKPVEFAQQVYKDALANALQTEYGNRDPEDNINMMVEDITNPNILQIMNYMDDVNIREVLETFSDEADEQFSDFNTVKNKKIQEGKDRVNDLMILYDNPKTSITEKNEIAKILLGVTDGIPNTTDLFFEPGGKNAFAQYHAQNLETNFKLSFNKTGNESLAIRLQRQYLDGDITFVEVEKYFPELNITQQNTLSGLRDERAKEQYTLAKEVIKGYFGFSGLVQPNPFKADDPIDILIEEATSRALQMFNVEVLKEGKGQDFETLIPKIAEKVYKDQKDRIFAEVNRQISTHAKLNSVEIAPYLSIPIEDITPMNVRKVIEDTEQNIQNDTELSKGQKRTLRINANQFIFDNEDLLIMMESYGNE